ncbi:MULTISPECIES: response regulator transcription factor [Sphingobium]|jgi:two-component system OmpR family response regulator|uniref:Response regulator transcription factor n=1 Tax=Sphingobium tyrosinilyticum TaxID=2715436 RepID=A0ABV9EZ72_9SPHN|nr:response regulator transcription factor [Sphingobium sp. EP60837]ANI79946.1 Transcriptional regulatory protein [Sphingobium sp. EP60837]
MQLLLVEDDQDLATQLDEQLRLFGHDTTVAPDGRTATELVAAQQFDAIILDRVLPGVDGVTVLRSMRDHNLLTPVIMMTALGQWRQKVEGLESGADDYVVKPVEPAELNARLHALMRARGWSERGSDETLRAGDLVISPARHSASRNGRTLNLQKTEFKLLTELARHADSVMTRAMLLERVWNYDFEPATNLVDASIRRLRIKLTEFDDPDPIVTVRGTGYMLRA